MKLMIYILRLLSKNLNNELTTKPYLQEIVDEKLEQKHPIICYQSFNEEIYRVTIERL